MSQSGYSEFGGNPYGGTGSGTDSGFAGSKPYGRTNEPTIYASGNPYGSSVQDYPSNPRPPIQHEPESDYSQPSQYHAPYTSQPIEPTNPSQPLPRDEFLQSIDTVKQQINHLSTSISTIATLHQRILSSPESASGTASSQLESLITQTQIQNTQITAAIKNLEKDAARDAAGNNSFKKSQVATLKRGFREQLSEYENEERSYRERYRDAIARQYRVVKPDATEDEVQEAAEADWGDEGVFQTALKSNRSTAAYTVLDTVRTRHHDIQRIERTLQELARLFEQLNEVVEVQGEMVANVENRADAVKNETERANAEIGKAVVSARRRQRLKWWLVGVIIAILVILGLVLGLYFGLRNRDDNNNNDGNNDDGRGGQ